MHRAFILRFDAKADFIQEADAVADPLDKRFFCDYAYITALTRQQFENGTEVGLRCSFEGSGAPILMIVEDMQLDAEGDARYATCVEAVIWKHGVNVWRYTHQDNSVCYYHAMADFSPLEEKVIHNLRIKIHKKHLLIQIDGKRSSVYIPDMPDKFWVGAALCEGECRLYDMDINENRSLDDFMAWDGYCEPCAPSKL